MSRVREAIQEISTFLSASIQTEAGIPLVKRLHNAIPETYLPPELSLTPQTEVILYSLELLRAVNDAATAEKWNLGMKDWKQINALTEVIIVLGLYKSLPPGVGLDETRRIKSVMLGKEGQHDELPQTERILLLRSFASDMKSFFEAGGSLGDNFRRRFNVDLLSAMADLAFNPSYPEQERRTWQPQYEQYLKMHEPLRAMLM